MSRHLTFVLVLGAAAGLWLLLSGADNASWLVGLPAVVAAAWAGRALGLFAGRGLSPVGLLRFLPFFLWESVRGGVDVARRVLAPRLKVVPGFFGYAVRLQHPGARLLFTNSVSLLPGTLAADLRGGHLEIHALDVGGDPAAELRRLETAVGRVYRERL